MFDHIACLFRLGYLNIDIHGCVEEVDPTLQIVRVRLRWSLQNEITLGGVLHRAREKRHGLVSTLMLQSHFSFQWL
jgi:hypothetical protein